MTVKKTPEKTPAHGESGLSFEQSLERLDTIVREMEDGSIGLEKMIEHFEEGQGLIEYCSKKLNEVERRIEILVKKQGGVATEKFDEEAPADDQSGRQSGGGDGGGELF